MEHIELLCDISELNWVFSETGSIEQFLQKTVAMTARHMHTDVCSIYLYDLNTQILTLKATYGLNADRVNQIKMHIGEGITGLALKELRPICDNYSSKHPNYKFFNGLKEEQFEALLAVPILRGIEKIGVLVVQRRQGHDFTTDDITALRAVSNQLANIIENARLLISLKDTSIPEKQFTKKEKSLKVVKGKPASTGFAFGPSKVEVKTRTLETLATRAGKKHHGIEEFKQAVDHTRKQLNERQQHVEERLSDVASLIFTAHLMMLQDDLFYGRIMSRITSGISAETAILETAQQFITFFSSQDNVLMREKADDVRDLAIRLVENLPGITPQHSFYEKRIIIARELLPSDILVLSSEGVAGIVLIAGGVTSHLSILTRSLGLPLIIADEPRLLDLPDATKLLLDGEIGNVYINPEKQIVTTFEMRNKTREEGVSLKESVAPETFTSDGKKITILANINLLTDCNTALQLKAEGIGLYRTEFPFIIRSTFPSEEEQFVIYRKLIENMKGKPVTFRTLDIGGDKILSYYDHLTEKNPFLGLRSIRFTLRNPEIFRQHIRAMLRAAHDTKLQIMFPMITTLEELIEARSVVSSCIEEMHHENIPFNSAPQVGIMIEIPALVEIIDTLAPMVDFMSIGTNDFVQYMLAVDRTNEKVAPLYLPHNPSVLRSLTRVVKGALAHSIPISICGDMAHQPEYIPFLLGIGIRTLSVDSIYIPKIQKCISSLSLAKARKIATAVLAESSTERIGEILGIRETD